MSGKTFPNASDLFKDDPKNSNRWGPDDEVGSLGVTFTEIVELDPLAADCAADEQYAFLYAAAPLKIRGGSGAPVNPIVVK